MEETICYFGVAHPWLCDVMGHMTTRFYVAMFDDASYHLFASVGYTQERIARGTGIVEMESTYTYIKEVRQGTMVQIAGRFTRLGNKSMTTEFEMTNRDNGDILARYKGVIVEFDLNERVAVPVSPDIRAKIELQVG